MLWLYLPWKSWLYLEVCFLKLRFYEVETKFVWKGGSQKRGKTVSKSLYSFAWVRSFKYRINKFCYGQEKTGQFILIYSITHVKQDLFIGYNEGFTVVVNVPNQCKEGSKHNFLLSFEVSLNYITSLNYVVTYCF